MKQPLPEDYQRLGDSKEALVKRSDLPLHCPTDDNAVWCAHPKVYLSIEDSEDKTVRCPYCGTLYRLLD
ncbi:MAG: zinc-finger domain-containing protein [Thiolinea sp.]